MKPETSYDDRRTRARTVLDYMYWLALLSVVTDTLGLILGGAIAFVLTVRTAVYLMW